LFYRETNIKTSEEWIYSVDFTQNTFKTNYTIQETDEIKLLFMNESGMIYSLTYKSKDNKTINRIFNVNLPNDKYALFISVNDTIYNANRVIVY
jgi:hypothetical protein